MLLDMADENELDAAGLRTVHHEEASGAALDQGATVISWIPRGQQEVLFLSREALVGIGEETHGGIPVCAPWFGTGRESVTVPHSHGLVRWVPWRLVEQGEQHLVWELEQREVAHLPGAAAYPSDLRYRVSARFGSSLEVALTVSSPTSEFILDEALHTYLRVSDVTRARIEGLEGVGFRDHAQDASPDVEHEPLRLGDHLDRIYDSAGPVTLVDGTRRVRVTQQGGANIVVWQPGPDPRLEGFAPDEWRSMVCIEVGSVHEQAVVVPAGGSHTLRLQLTLED